MLPAYCTTLPRQGPANDRFDAPGVSGVVVAAVPAGSVVARSQAGFLRAVDEHSDTALLRVDGREHLRAVAWVLAAAASWADLTTRPTWPVIAQRAGLSRASVARWVAWLRARGLLGVVETGTTPQFAPMALAKDGPNRAARYVLCTPKPPPAATSGAFGAGTVTTSETPTLSAFEPEEKTPTRARESRTRPANAGQRGPLRGREPRGEGQGRPTWPRTAVAGSRADQLALVARIRETVPALRGLSTPALRHLLRPWLARPELGWTITWLLHALDVTPDGSARTCTDAVRAPAGWLRHRMGAWLDGHGQPLPSPGVAIAAAAAAVRDRADRDRADRDRQTRAAAADHAFGHQIRAAAGERYPALVATVMAHQPPAATRLLPASAAEALTRQAVRAALHNPPASDDTAAAAAIAAAVDELLTAGRRADRAGT